MLLCLEIHGQKFNRAGEFLGQWGYRGRSPGRMMSPQGLAVAENNAVYVADFDNDRVQEFLPRVSGTDKDTTTTAR